MSLISPWWTSFVGCRKGLCKRNFKKIENYQTLQFYIEKVFTEIDSILMQHINANANLF